MWKEVYFPFRSGALAYACGPCGAKCCKGGAGLAFDKDQLTQLRLTRPELGLFVDPRRSHASYVEIDNHESSCYFLAASDLCGLHAAAGRAAKPFLCQVFPVNAYRLVDDVLVADLNTYCPLHPAGRHADEQVLHHADLLADIETHRDVILASLRGRHRPGRWSLAREIAQRDAETTFDPAVHARLCRFLELDLTWRPELLAPHALLRPRQRLMAHEKAPALVDRLHDIHATFLLAAAQLGAPPSLVGADTMFHRSLPLYAFLAHLDDVPVLAPLAGDELELPGHDLAADEVSRLLAFVYEDNDERGLSFAEIFDELDIHGPMTRVAVLRSLPLTLLERLFPPPRYASS